MEGLYKYSDLENHFSDFLTIIDQQNETAKGKRDLAAAVEKLTQEIEILKKSEQKLTQQLQTFSSSAEAQGGINSLYLKLKEKYNELQDKCNRWEKEKVELDEKFKQERNKITEDFQRQIKILEERNEEQKKINSELCNELSAQQALADFRYDEMESQLESKIGDSTKKLHDSIQSCRTMRDELLTFKGRHNSDMESANKRIQELEKKLQLSQQQLQLTQEKLFNTTRNKSLDVYSNNDNSHREINQPRSTLNDSDRPSTNIIKNRIVMYNEKPQRTTSKPNYVCGTTKYHSLNAGTSINQETSSSEEFQEVLRDVNIPAERLRSAQFVAPSSRYNQQGGSKFSIPSLKQVSVNSGTVPKQRMNIKRRKLYNPNNLDYLHDMEQPE